MKYFGTITDPKDLVNKEYIDDVADTKANIDGAYENMTVGNAEQLVSTVMVNDQEPYIFRTSGGSADIGDREYDTIVGGSLAWNQLVQNGNFANSTAYWGLGGGTASVADGVLTYIPNTIVDKIDQTISGISANHVYLLTANVKATDATSEPVLVSYLDTSGHFYNYTNNVTTWGAISKIEKVVTPYVTPQIQFRNVANTMPSDTSIQVKNCMVIDLTQLFGSTIADYIYNLEQSNAGDGVAYVTKLFPQLNGDYYAYNAGELLHVQGLQSHNMTEFNQWDEEWERGSFDANGQKISSSSNIRSKNYIPIFPDTIYYIYIAKSNINVLFYDVKKAFLGASGYKANQTITTPSGAYYAMFRVNDPYGTTYNNDICINLSWDGERNGEYEPYKLNSYPLDSTITLRGIPVLDANNKLKYDGDRYLADGTVDRRYGIVDLGTLEWTMVSGTTFPDTFFANVPNGANAVSGGKRAICAKFVTVYPLTSEQMQTDFVGVDKTLIFANTNFSGTAGRVAIHDSAYADAATLKVAMSGVYLVYELATPTTETADPYQSPQIVDDFGTEEYVVTLQGDVAVPVGHDTNYANNLRAKLEMAPESPSGDGDYIVRQTSGQNAYVPLVFPVDELPVAPSEDGTYTLQVTISGGTATYSWVSA